MRTSSVEISKSFLLGREEFINSEGYLNRLILQVKM